MTEDKNGRPKKGDKEPSFEAAMERLEKVVEEMESGKLDLETLIARFEEGQKLMRFCSGKLSEIEKRVEVLVKKGDQMVAEPFEPGAGDEEKPPPAEVNGQMPF